MNSEGFYEDSDTWITGKELIERWPRVTPKSLLGRILEEYGFDCPQIRPVIHVIFDEKVGDKVPGPSWSEQELRVLRSIGSVEDMKSAIEDSMFFNLLDVKEYEEYHPEVLLMPGQDKEMGDPSVAKSEKRVSTPKKPQSTIDRESVDDRVKSMCQSGSPLPSRNQLLQEVIKNPEWNVYSERTLLKWISHSHPDYTPGKPGRKKKKS